ncbi:MAG: alpha/beta hydrolase [Candidatus Levybacteria bacterium]|nr:alpha/beta hydrolase [Candidatus Levybacteria bacterium]
MRINNVYPRSRHHKDLWFRDEPHGRVTYFEHSFEAYSLEGRILYNEHNETPWVLSVHGARADFTKSDAVSIGLQKRGFSLLGMNMSGHSKAGVLSPEQTTLGGNVDEVSTFYDYLAKDRKKVIIAYSLGGTPALKLLEKHSDAIDKMILFYPGIYITDAYVSHFGAEFRSTIAEPFSYRKNDTINLLRSFKGKLLVIKGEYDGLDPELYAKPPGGSAGEVAIDGIKYYSPIPKEVIDIVYNAVPVSRREFIEIPSCGHSVVLWMRENPIESEKLLDKINAFLK